MLELARTSATEHVDESSGEGLSALGLSEREAEVALLVAEGRTHKEIGAQLFISPKTVEHHVAKIRQKLGAGSRAELLAIIRDAAETH
jgi:DNA-binding CsgD family transcriptional regulator